MPVNQYHALVLDPSGTHFVVETMTKDNWEQETKTLVRSSLKSIFLSSSLPFVLDLKITAWVFQPRMDRCGRGDRMLKVNWDSEPRLKLNFIPVEFQTPNSSSRFVQEENFHWVLILKEGFGLLAIILTDNLVWEIRRIDMFPV